MLLTLLVNTNKSLLNLSLYRHFRSLRNALVLERSGANIDILSTTNIMSNSSNSTASSANNTTKTIVITGGFGNLGTKLSHHLLSTTSTTSQYKVYLIEHPNFVTPKSTKHKHPDAILLPCDLGNPTLEHTAAIKQALEEADCLIHFSAVNPYPNATWSESAQSMDHTFYIFQLAVLCKGELCWLLF